MNSVFSAFKSSNRHDTKQKSSSGKKIITQDSSSSNNSYEKLRHIREISCGKMSNFVEVEGQPTAPVVTTTNGNCLSIQSPTTAPIVDKSVVDQPSDINDLNGEDCVDHSAVVALRSDLENLDLLQQDQCIFPTWKSKNIVESETNSNCSLSNSNNCNSNTTTLSSSSSLSSASASATTTNAPSNSWNSRFHKPRLSISSAGSGASNNSSTTNSCNNSMPSVHGRSNANGTATANGQNGVPPKTRLSTHQRNLSLDFR